MADRKTGIADDIQIIRESDSQDVTGDLGVIANAEYIIDLPENPRSSVGKAPTLQYAVQQPARIQLRLDLEPSGLDVFKLQGTFTDNGDGTYDVTLDDRLPDFTAKLQVTDSDDNLELSGLKFLTGTLTIQNGEPVEATFEADGTDAQFIDETVTTPDPSDPVQPLDAFLRLGGNDVGAADSASITHDRSQGRDAGPVRGLKDPSVDERRSPDQIIEGNKILEFDTTVQITDAQAYEETFNSTSQPFGVDDADARTTMTIVLNESNEEFQLTDAKVTQNTGELTNEAGEVRTADLSGNSFTASISGDT